MPSLAHDLKPTRLVVFWILFFVPVYLSTLFLYSYWSVTLNPFVSITLQVIAPLWYLLMAWLYFRRIIVNTWAARFVVAVVWVFLTLLASALLIQPVYGYDWRFAINTQVLAVQVVNIAGILVGGWAASHKRAMPSVDTASNLP
jgi:hypothetical protein